MSDEVVTLPDAESDSAFQGLDGKSYTPVFTLRALAAIKKETGRNLVREAFDFSDPELLEVVLYRTLLFRHPEMTIERAGNLLDATSLLAALPVLLKAFNAATPEPEAGGDAAANPPKA